MSLQSFHKLQQHYIIPILLILLNISLCLMIYFFFELSTSQSKELLPFYAFENNTQQEQYLHFVQVNVIAYLIASILQTIALFFPKPHFGILVSFATILLFYYTYSGKA